MPKVEFVRVIAACGIAAGLVLGHFPAPMSIGAVLLAICGLILNKAKDYKHIPLILIVVFYIWQLISGLWTSNLNDWEVESIRKISFILIPLGLIQSSIRFSKSILIVYNISVFIVAIGSVINYLLHQAQIDIEITKSTGMPIISGISHIYFSILNGLAIFSSIYLSQHRDISYKQKRIWVVVSVLLIISLHILSSRTGLVAFYITFLIVLVRYIILRKKWLYGLLFITLLTIMPVVAYQVSSSFKNRIENTIEDLDHYFNGKYIHYYSISMRFEAWKVCWSIFTDSPIIGVGNADLPSEMNDKYDQKNMVSEVRLFEAHNQYLEHLASLGIIGFISLIVIMIEIIRGRIRSYIAIAVLGVFAVSFLFESVLESHNGIAAFALFYGIITGKGK